MDAHVTRSHPYECVIRSEAAVSVFPHYITKLHLTMVIQIDCDLGEDILSSCHARG